MRCKTSLWKIRFWYRFVNILLKKFCDIIPERIKCLLETIEFQRYYPLSAVIFFILMFILAYVNDSNNINHFVIISTTYYPSSKIYSKNTAVILFNSEVNVSTRNPLICISRNATHQISHPVKTRFAYAPVNVCRWTAFISTCGVVENMHNFALTHSMYGSGQVEVPFRPASYRKLEVAACFSPLFYNENWQLLLTTLEVYRHFGVSLQVFYIQSIIAEMFSLLEVYQKYDVAAIEPWATLGLGDEIKNDLGYDPNTELDWRNQATAHTDCLLKYREAADFIIIGDIDDVLFPRLAQSYFEEFRLLSTSKPNYAGFIYNRYNTEIVTGRTPRTFSISSMLSTAKISNEWEDGKYVVNTSLAETAWLHWPGITINKAQMYTVSSKQNIMVHMRNWTVMDHPDYGNFPENHKIKPFKIQMNQIIFPTRSARIQDNFKTMMKDRTEFDALPNSTHYLPLIVDCYNKIFYSRRKRPTSCPGPIRCQIPDIDGLECRVAKKPYKRSKIHERIFIYTTGDQGKFLTRNNGCSL